MSGILESAYNLLLDPNILFLLYIVAIVGLFVEISHPGAILPGVMGALALVLFLFGAGSIGPNWAGLLLMVLAFVLLVLDVRMPTHGVLTVGAMLSLIFGSLIFFNSGAPYNEAQVNPVIVYIMAGVVGLFGFIIIGYLVNARRKGIMKTGVEGMIGARAVALTPLNPQGRVMYGGENWLATLEDPTVSLDPGAEVQIVSVAGLHLYVRPAPSQLSYPDALNIVSE